MRNVISIDTRDNCSCEAIVATDTKTSEIVIEVITGNDKKPRLKLINGEGISYITLDANQSNYVNIPSESWVLGGALQIQYEATGRTGELYTISFPDVINDITVNQISETEFSVKSLVIGTQPLTVKDIVNNLNSTDIYKVLGADQGGVLKTLIDTNVINIEALKKLVNDNVTDIQGDLTDIELALANQGKVLDSKITNVSNSVTALNTGVAGISNMFKRYDHNSSPNFTFDGAKHPIFSIHATSRIDADNVCSEIGVLTHPNTGRRVYYRYSHGTNLPNEWTGLPEKNELEALQSVTITNVNGEAGGVTLTKMGKLVIANFSNLKPFYFSGAIIPDGYRPTTNLSLTMIAYRSETDCYTCYADILTNGRIDSFLQNTLNSRARNTTHGFYGSVAYFTN